MMRGSACVVVISRLFTKQFKTSSFIKHLLVSNEKPQRSNQSWRNWSPYGTMDDQLRHSLARDGWYGARERLARPLFDYRQPSPTSCVVRVSSRMRVSWDHSTYVLREYAVCCIGNRGELSTSWCYGPPWLCLTVAISFLSSCPAALYNLPTWYIPSFKGFQLFTKICHLPQQRRRCCFLLRLEITWFVVPAFAHARRDSWVSEAERN